MPRILIRFDNNKSSWTPSASQANPSLKSQPQPSSVTNEPLTPAPRQPERRNRKYFLQSWYSWKDEEFPAHAAACISSIINLSYISCEAYISNKAFNRVHHRHLVEAQTFLVKSCYFSWWKLAVLFQSLNISDEAEPFPALRSCQNPNPPKILYSTKT